MTQNDTHGPSLRVHTREELGVDPNESPSLVLAGVASCCHGDHSCVLAGRGGLIQARLQAGMLGPEPGEAARRPGNRQEVVALSQLEQLAQELGALAPAADLLSQAGPGKG